MSFKYYNFKLIGEGVFSWSSGNNHFVFLAGGSLSLTTSKVFFNFLLLCFTAIMIISLNIMINV